MKRNVLFVIACAALGVQCGRPPYPTDPIAWCAEVMEKPAASCNVTTADGDRLCDLVITECPNTVRCGDRELKIKQVSYAFCEKSGTWQVYGLETSIGGCMIKQWCL